MAEVIQSLNRSRGPPRLGKALQLRIRIPRKGVLLSLLLADESRSHATLKQEPTPV